MKPANVLAPYDLTRKNASPDEGLERFICRRIIPSDYSVKAALSKKKVFSSLGREKSAFAPYPFLLLNRLLIPYGATSLRPTCAEFKILEFPRGSFSPTVSPPWTYARPGRICQLRSPFLVNTRLLVLGAVSSLVDLFHLVMLFSFCERKEATSRK